MLEGVRYDFISYRFEFSEAWSQKYGRLRCLLHVKGLGICFYLGWSGTVVYDWNHYFGLSLRPKLADAFGQ